MNITVAQRSQVHIPWMTIGVIVLMSLLAAAAVLVLVSQQAELTVGTSPAVLAAPGAAVVPKPESRAQDPFPDGEAAGPRRQDRRPGGASVTIW